MSTPKRMIHGHGYFDEPSTLAEYGSFEDAAAAVVKQASPRGREA